MFSQKLIKMPSFVSKVAAAHLTKHCKRQRGKNATLLYARLTSNTVARKDEGTQSGINTGTLYIQLPDRKSSGNSEKW